MKAQVIYWFPLSEGVQDGGSHRARAWVEALRAEGFEVLETPVHSSPAEEWGSRGSGRQVRQGLSNVKQRVAPMPFKRRAPEILPESDLVVATVPAVFSSVLRSSTRDQLVVMDWMDLWSSAAASFKHSSGLSGVGGSLQAALWRSREQRLFRAPVMHSFAGYGDLNAAPRSDRHWWLPTPMEWQIQSPATPSRISRVGFIGNLHYRPNAVSLNSFVERHLADLELNGIELVVAGPGTERLRGTAANLRALGKVEDVDDFYRGVDAVVVPVDVGGGIKVKAVEGLSRQLPVFGTEHVRQGFSPELRRYILNIRDLTDSAVEPAVITREEFDRSLGRDAFGTSVAAMLRGKSC